MKALTDVLQRTFVPVLALLVLLAAGFAPLTDGWRIALAVIAAPLLLLGLYDWFQIRFTITRN